MPPEKQPAPTAEETRRLVRWITRLHAGRCRPAAAYPAMSRMRRLNRVEYDNTIRDLLGVQFQPAEDFHPTTSVRALTTSATCFAADHLMEKYLAPPIRSYKSGIVSAESEEIGNESISPRKLKGSEQTYTNEERHHDPGHGRRAVDKFRSQRRRLRLPDPGVCAAGGDGTGEDGKAASPITSR